MNFNSFRGRAQTAIDGKGRSSFPREFRRQLSPSDGSEFIITRAPNRILQLFIPSEYDKFMADLDSRSDRRQADMVRRSLCSTPVELDGQNRILFPKILLEYADLKNEVLYVGGRGKTLELWNPKRFKELYDLETPESVETFEAGYYGESLAEGVNGKL